MKKTITNLIIVFSSLFIVLFFISVSFISLSLEKDVDRNEMKNNQPKVLITGSYRFPLNSGFITSMYGFRWGTIHYGIDASTVVGANLYPFADGVVSEVGYDVSRGNYIYIFHNVDGNLYTTAYYHMLKTANVKVGATVDIETIIGQMGNTGDSTGPHLHFEISNGHNQGYRNHIVNAFDPNNIFNFKINQYFSYEVIE